MKIKGVGIKYKLIFSHFLVILVFFGLIAFFKNVFLSLIFALGLAFVLGSALTAGIIKPVNRIVYISRKFSRGDFSQKILLGSRDEIGELAATLNKMAEGLENKIKEIEVQNQYQRAILESMVEGIIVTDKSGRIVSVNPSVEKIFDISGKDSQGRLFLDVIRNNDIADVVSGVLENGRFVSREISLIWPVQRIFQLNASPVFEKNAVCGCLLVIHDITEIRRLEVMRRDFVANVSHELKTPLTSIKGFVETLLDEGALEDRENSLNFLRIIRTHADRLDALVDDLLDLSRLESQELSPAKEKINLKDLADDVLAGFESRLKEKAITPENDLPADLSPGGDREEMRRVLINLIDNAVKFNPEKGCVRIYGRDMGDKVKVVVEDTGCGIPEKDIPRIFERFYRVDKARSRRLGGTGLGLSIVKHIVELHGGSVGVESAENLGSKFWFTLPK